MTKLALVQKSPVFLDTTKSVGKAIKYIHEAKESSADIIVFGEGWLSGYPAWIDHSIHMGRWDQKEIKEVWAQMFDDGIEIPGPQISKIQHAAQVTRKYVVIGANEAVKKGKGNGTLYNTLLIIDPNGKIVVHP